jgi:multidrug/hemolysin transport system ATP-binding protein
LDALELVLRLKEFITGFEVTAGTMDDAFIGITGKEIRS